MRRYARVARRFVLGLALAACLSVLAVAGIVSVRSYDLWQQLPSADAIAIRYRLADDGKPTQTSHAPAYVQLSVLAAEDPDYLENGTRRWPCLRALLIEWLKPSDDWIELCQPSIASSVSRIILTELGTTQTAFGRQLSLFLMTYELEGEFSRQQILSLYIKRAYFGRDAFGFSDAAQTYFGRPAQSLNLPQAALLAALIRAPGWYNPAKFPERAKQRRDLILARMAEHGMISRAEILAALSTPLLP